MGAICGRYISVYLLKIDLYYIRVGFEFTLFFCTFFVAFLFLTQIDKNMHFLCTRNKNQLKQKAMGKSYKMRCKHCGAEFLHIRKGVFGVLRECDYCDSHIVTEISIRCPQCARRINRTEDEFRSQIMAMMAWA